MRHVFALVATCWLVAISAGEEIVLQQGISPAGYAGCTDTTLMPEKADAEKAHGAEPALRLRGVANRLLVRFELPGALKGRRIDSAELMLFVPAVADNHYYAEFICARVLTVWDDQATWTRATVETKWGRPGGDFDQSTDYANGRPAGAMDSESFFASPKRSWLPPEHIAFDVPTGGRWVGFDVTPAVEAWLSGKAANRGVCITGVNIQRKNTAQYAAAEIPSAEYEKDSTLRPKLIIHTSGDGPGYLVGAAHSMRRLCDRSPRYKYRGGDAGEYSISAARNEYECFQLVVKPLRRALKAVRFDWTDLTDARTGKTIPRGRLACSIPRTVKLTWTWYTRDYYRKAHDVPDPLLPAEPVELPRGQAQPFWFELHVPADAAAGSYVGTIRVLPANAPPRKLKLTVRVWNYAIPKQWNFHTMGQMIWREVRRYHGRISPELRRKYVDFLIDHRYSPTRQYANNLSPEAEDIAHYVARGGNTIYLSGNYKGDLQQVKQRYETVRKILGEKAEQVICIVYIGDEVTRIGDLQKLCRKADLVHAELPGAMVMIGGSYPHAELIGYLDIFDPKLATAEVAARTAPGRLLYKMDDGKAAAVRPARARGEEVYFYGDLPPLADGLHGGLECPVIGTRLMMWQAWKFALNGHELYCYNIWEQNAVGKDGKKWPEIPWNAESFRNRNAGGMMFYPGPVSSIRLKNARDGIEDWESFQVLADCAAALTRIRASTAVPLLARARTMLAVPGNVTRGFTRWTRDGEVVLAERSKLSALIERCIAVIGRDGYEKAAAARRTAETQRRINMLRERTRQARARLAEPTTAPAGG